MLLFAAWLSCSNINNYIVGIAYTFNSTNSPTSTKFERLWVHRTTACGVVLNEDRLLCWGNMFNDALYTKPLDAHPSNITEVTCYQVTRYLANYTDTICTCVACCNTLTPTHTPFLSVWYVAMLTDSIYISTIIINRLRTDAYWSRGRAVLG